MIAPWSSQAQEGFRIETDINVEGYEQPVSRTLSLFRDGAIYDMSRDEGQDITLIEPSLDRITRFNEATKTKTHNSISELKKLIPAAEQQAAQGPLAIFLAGAQSIQVTKEKIVVGREPLRYEATLQKPLDADNAGFYVQLYQQFADASKLLNSFSTGGDPPFARLALNKALAKQGAIPKEIKLYAKRGGKEIVYSSRLHVNWGLSKYDKERITKIQDMLANFEQVTPAEYNRRVQAALVPQTQQPTAVNR
ncbi:MAG: hypothetical protein AAF483_23755 [Planctomycetota bacterium]